MRALKKIYELLDGKERNQLFAVISMMTVVAFFELIGVASIFPFISVLTNESVIHTSEYFSAIYSYLNFSNPRDFIVFLGGCVFISTVLSSSFNLYTNYKIFKFNEAITYSLSYRLMQSYLGRDYSFFLQRNTSDLAKNLLTEIQQLTNGVLVPALLGCSRAIIVAVLFSMLMISNYVVALSLTGVLGGSYVLIYFLVKPALVKAGKEQNKANKVRYESSAKAFGGIKEIKLFQNSDYFLREFSECTKNHGHYQVLNDTLSTLPKHLLEIVAFGGIVGVMLALYLGSGDISKVLPILSLFTVAGYKSLPALQSVYNSLARIKFYSSTVDLLHMEFKNGAVSIQNEFHQKKITFKDSIVLSNVSFSYSKESRNIIEKLSLEIKRNSTIGFVGSTGAGKTTIVDIIMGLLQHTDGEILVDGIPIDRSTIQSWQEILSYVPQRIYLSDETVINNIAFGIDKDKIDFDLVIEVSKMARIHDFIVDELSDGYDTFIGERGIRLSGGQAQRIGIARALYRKPSVLVLDEATSALDNVTESEIVETIRSINGSCTIIMIAHRLSTVEGCDQIYYINDGQLLGNGHYKYLIKHNSSFREFAKSRHEV